MLALICWLAVAGLFQYGAAIGVGKNLWDVSIADVYPNLLRLWVFGAMLYSICMLAIKMSILLMYRRLFPIGNFFTRWW